MSTVSIFATDPSPAELNAEKFGLLTILPPLVAIVLAFITKNVVISLFIGVFAGAFLLGLNDYGAVGAIFQGFVGIVGYIIDSLADSWNAGIILQCLTIGGLIALISKMGGARAVAESLSKRAKTPRSAQLITWFLGLFIFFDDYANALIVGPIMRPVTDKMKISRERLAFVIDATAAPIAGMALISTWIGYEIGLINDAYASIGQNVNAYGVFISTIPYRFYNILILAFIVITAVLLKEFGPMYKAEKRARLSGKVTSPNSKPMTSEEGTDLMPKAGIKLSIWNAIVPIAVLIVTAFAGFYYNGYLALADDPEVIQMIKNAPLSMAAIRETFGASDASIVLFQAALIGSIVALLMGVKQKIFTISEGIDTWIQGMKSLVITGVILLLAWSLSGVISELGTNVYLVSRLSDSLPAFLLPTIIFILGSAISFATGTSYGTMGILMPLAIPLAFAINPDQGYVLMSVGAVLTGAIFGDHCSPISDTTILSSMGADCDHVDHIKTQITYAITVGLVTVLFGYIPVGLGVPVYIVLPVALAVIFAIVHIFGKSVEMTDLKKESAH
ncbi:Na+/H+ antiporter NhaC family protein [Serpentinicella sp. ANB-PHB4]|uniref:Na+/H+ antiporter NhaC family protein n=1 Tax=Serpentinicella sp. ANB-PHB4 TaxID=3074076 RepID=UPI002FE6DBFB